MDVRKETKIVQLEKNMVLAQQDQYFVAVIKKPSSKESDIRYVVVITEQSSLKSHREILCKEFSELNVFMKFLAAIIPEYIVKNEVINKTYTAIYELINKK